MSTPKHRAVTIAPNGNVTIESNARQLVAGFVTRYTFFFAGDRLSKAQRERVAVYMHERGYAIHTRP